MTLRIRASKKMAKRSGKKETLQKKLMEMKMKQAKMIQNELTQKKDIKENGSAVTLKVNIMSYRH